MIKKLLESLAYVGIIASMPIIFTLASIVAMFIVGRFVISEYPQVAFNMIYHKND
jgi:hypothetical protein